LFLGLTMKLQTRLSLITTSMMIFALLGVLVISSWVSEKTLKNAAYDKLAAIQSSRYSELTDYLEHTQAKLRLIALAPKTGEALSDLSAAFAQLGCRAQPL
jgi:hypothetical protein